MKIVKRSWMSSPVYSVNLWAIPLMFYSIQKYVGIIRPDREWIWWVLIPTSFLFWFVINFKVVKDEND